jgi:hypothetical protein
LSIFIGLILFAQKKKKKKTRENILK